METTSIAVGIISMFFVTVTVSCIKNVLYNANSLARQLRMWAFSLYGFYLLVISFTLPYFMLYSHEINDLGLWLRTIGLISLSILVLGTTLKFDERKTSVRDEWKYRSTRFENFKTSKPFKSKFEIFNDLLVFFVVLITFGSNVSGFIYNIVYYKHQWMATTNFSLIFILLIVFYVWKFKYLHNLIKDNIRYNLMKEIVINDKDREWNHTKEEVAKKGLELYRKIFLESKFYCKNVNTNNAIVIEFDIFGRLGYKKVKQYTRRENTTSYLSEEEYNQLKGS